jgi:hypothetical protein
LLPGRFCAAAACCVAEPGGAVATVAGLPLLRLLQSHRPFHSSVPTEAALAVVVQSSLAKRRRLTAAPLQLKWRLARRNQRRAALVPLLAGPPKP